MHNISTIKKFILQSILQQTNNQQWAGEHILP